MKFKNIIAISLIAALALGLTACGSDEATNSAASSTSESNNTFNEKKTEEIDNKKAIEKKSEDSDSINIILHGFDVGDINEVVGLSDNNTINIYYNKDGSISYIDIDVSDNNKISEFKAEEENYYLRNYKYDNGESIGYVDKMIAMYDSELDMKIFTEKEYDINGKLLKETDYQEDGTITYEVIYTEDGNEEVTDYLEDGSVRDKMIIDSYGNVISEYSNDGFEESNQKTEVDDKGRKLKRTWYRDDGSIEAYLEWEYNADGSYTITDWEYLKDGSVGSYFISKYDANDNLIEDIEYNADGSIKEVKQ